MSPVNSQLSRIMMFKSDEIWHSQLMRITELWRRINYRERRSRTPSDNRIRNKASLAENITTNVNKRTIAQ